MRDRAIQRLRDAVRRRTDALNELESADRELIEAATALDMLEQAELPHFREMRGILNRSDT